MLLHWTQDAPLYLLPLLVLPLFTFFGGGQEELGWRGYLQPELEERVNLLLASILVGIIWAFWHWPLFVLPGYPQNDLSIVAYTLFVIPQSIILTWIYYQSQGSTLVCVLYHGMLNAVSFATMQLGYVGGILPIEVLSFGLYVVITIGLLLWTGTRLGQPSKENTFNTNENRPAMDVFAV